MEKPSSTELIMSSTKVTDQAVQTISTNETVVALLREISDHLARIENANVKLASGESKCSTAAPKTEQVEDVIEDMKTGSEQGQDLTSSDEPETEVMVESGNRVTVSSTEKLETVKISYPAPHPLDDLALRQYQTSCDGKLGRLLESSGVQKRLRCLPPNDGRVALKVSREFFLALILKPIASSDNLQAAEEACLESLNNLSLESSEMYVQDYSHDSKGKFAEWDFHREPQFWVQEPAGLEVASDSLGFGQWEWPANWSSSVYDHTPYRLSSLISAPWCRFM